MKILTCKPLYGGLAVFGLSLFPALGGLDSAQAKQQRPAANARATRAWQNRARANKRAYLRAQARKEYWKRAYYQQRARKRDWKRAYSQQRSRKRDWRRAYYQQRARERARARQRALRQRALRQRQWRNTGWRISPWRTAPVYRWRPYTPRVSSAWRMVDRDYFRSLGSAQRSAAHWRSRGYYTTINWSPTARRYVLRKYVRRY